MGKKELRHVDRRLTEEERARHARIREAAIRDIPPKEVAARNRILQPIRLAGSLRILTTAVTATASALWNYC
jgi:hypothetical protein